MDEKLIKAALLAAKGAYAPYSNFRVGAAVELEDGTVVTGNNQENAAYPSGMCAERVALFFAKSQYPDLAIRRVAVASPSTTGLITPCGACRQVMAEIAMNQNFDFEVVMYSEKDGTVVRTVAELLPMAFVLK